MLNRKRKEILKSVLLFLVLELVGGDEPLRVINLNNLSVQIDFHLESSEILGCIKNNQVAKLSLDYKTCTKLNKDCSIFKLKRELQLDPSLTNFSLNEDTKGDKLPGFNYLISSPEEAISALKSPIRVNFQQNQKFLSLRLEVKCFKGKKNRLSSLILPFIKNEKIIISTNWLNFKVNGD